MGVAYPSFDEAWGGASFVVVTVTDNQGMGFRRAPAEQFLSRLAAEDAKGVCALIVCGICTVESVLDRTWGE